MIITKKHFLVAIIFVASISNNQEPEGTFPTSQKDLEDVPTPMYQTQDDVKKQSPKSQCITLGDLKDCQRVIPLGYYELPSIKTCKNIDDGQQNLTTFKGRVLRYNPTVTTFFLWYCSLYYKRRHCALDGKTTARIEPGTVIERDCRSMIYDKKTIAYYKETLIQVGPYKYMNNPKKSPTCHFLNDPFTFWEPYFSLTGYPVKLIGNNNLIQQDVTRAKLYVLRNKSLDLQF